VSGPVDVLAVLSGLEGVFQDIPSREGSMADAEAFALAAAMVKTRAAMAELIEAATSAKNALAIIAGAEESDTSDKLYQLLFDDPPRLRAALANVGSAS
jgi:hypothetical protein